MKEKEITNAQALKELKKNEKYQENLESALKVISTWATFQHGKDMDPKHVADLCKRALNNKP